MIIETKINLNNKTKDELIMLLNESSQVIQKYEKELETQSKQIGLMAEDIYDNISMTEMAKIGVSPRIFIDGISDEDAKKIIIEYFKKKASEEE